MSVCTRHRVKLEKSDKRGGMKVGMVDTPVYSEPFKQLAFDLLALFRSQRRVTGIC